MVQAKEQARQLRIKLGTVKRTKKEYEFYLKEEQENRTKIAKMREENKSESDLKQQQEVLNETLTVLPDSKGRLEKFATDLKQFVDEIYGDEEAKDEPANEEDKNLAECRTLLKEVENVCPELKD